MAAALLTACVGSSPDTGPTDGGDAGDAADARDAADLDSGGPTGRPPQDAGAPDADAAGPDPYGVCSEDGWCFALPFPTESALHGVLEDADGNYWMLGDSGKAIVHDGEGFRAGETGTEQTIHRTWQASAGDGWAVGAASTVLRLTDGGLTTVALVEPSDAAVPPGEDLFAVWGSSDADLWVGGQGGVLWHRVDGVDGVDGTFERVPYVHGQAIRGLWGSAADNIVAVGDGGRIGRFDGTAWMPETSPTGTHLHDVRGQAADDIWAVGDSGRVLHYDGVAWMQLEGPGDVHLYAVEFDEDGAVVVGGQDGEMFRRIDNGGDEDTWEQLSSGLTATVRAFSGQSGPGFWAVGDRGTVAHWLGTTRRLYSAGGDGNYLDIFAAPGEPQWIIGDETLRGTGLEPTDVGTDRSLFGGFALGASDAWAVGTSGTIMRWQDDGWTEMLSGTDRLLRSVWAADDATAWIAGDNGTMLGLFNRTQWIADSIPTNGDVHDIWGSAFDDVWAVAEQGSLMHYDGSSWEAVAVETDADLRSVYGRNADDVWVVGSLGNILHWNGSAWSVEQSGEGYTLNAVWARAADDAYAVGTGGTLLHYNGKKWRLRQSGTLQVLNGVYGDAEHTYVVGAAGVVLTHAL